MSKTRHSKTTWINAGLAALREDGPDALRAEPLARRLGTTKGSFYWHFKDVPAFHAALIEQWKSDAFETVVMHLSAQGSPRTRLLAFGTAIMQDATDPAIRHWKTRQTDTAIAQVDEQRLTFITTLLRQIGLSNPDFAQACYGALLGLPNTHHQRTPPAPAFEALIDLVVALK